MLEYLTTSRLLLRRNFLQLKSAIARISFAALIAILPSAHAAEVVGGAFPKALTPEQLATASPDQSFTEKSSSVNCFEALTHTDREFLSELASKLAAGTGLYVIIHDPASAETKRKEP